MGKIKAKDHLDIKICYEEYDGECYKNDKFVVIVSQPDDSGVWVEDPNTGDEEFAKCSEIFFRKDVGEAIQEVKKTGKYR